MKNLLRVLGITTIFTVIALVLALVFTACGDGEVSGGFGKATIVVNNQYSYPIIGIIGGLFSDLNLNITQGNSQTLNMNNVPLGGSASSTVSIYTTDPNYGYTNNNWTNLRVTADTSPNIVRFEADKTTTITLTAEGRITYTAPR